MTLLLVLFVQSAALLTLGFLALFLTRRRGPAVQTLVGRATLSGVALLLLLAPLSGHIAPLWRLPVGPPAPSLGSRSSDKNTRALPILPSAVPSPLASAAPAIPSDARPAALGAASSAPTPSPSVVPHPSSRKDPALEVRGKEAAGLPACLLLLWLVACQWQLVRLRRAARPLPGGPAADLLASLTPRPPALLTHPAVQSPFLAGAYRPAIFLPPTYETDFAPDALRAVFLHELAHLGRRDNHWTLAARILTAVLWFQPLLWLLCRRMEHVSEDACDQAVLAAHCPPRAYAACLLALTKRPPLRASHRPLTAAVTPYRSSVGRRISRILTSGVPIMPAVTLTLRLRLFIAALTVAAALGGTFLVSSVPAQTQATQQNPHLLTAQERQYVAERNQDLANLKAIGQALVHYEGSNPNWRLPDANHWMDQIAPYLPDRSVLFDPFQPGKHRYGYAFNRNCSDKSLMYIDDPTETVAVFDSTLGTRNASDTGASLRINPGLDWSSRTRVSPVGSNYGFADGHAKFFRINRHPSFSLAGGMPSIDGDDQSILGVWVNPGSGAAKTALIFSSANSIEKVSPWPDDTRRLVHFYGRYNVHPTDLKYIFTRVWVEGKPMYTIAPEKHLVGCALSEDGQTITLKDKSASVYRRSHIYTAQATTTLSLVLRGQRSKPRMNSGSSPERLSACADIRAEQARATILCLRRQTIAL